MSPGGWGEFAVASVAFAGSHFLPACGELREGLIRRWGRRGYFAGYGLVSLLLLGWMIVAAGHAPYVELWPPQPWTRWVPVLVMPLAVFLAVAGIGIGYPFTLGGRRDAAFDPAHPGFAALTRHPLLWALTLWSVAHLAPNGDLAHILLFGGFAIISAAAVPVFDRRAVKALSRAESVSLFRAAPLLSPMILFAPAWVRKNARFLLLRLILSGVVLEVVVALHGPLIGVSPFPG